MLSRLSAPSTAVGRGIAGQTKYRRVAAPSMSAATNSEASAAQTTLPANEYKNVGPPPQRFTVSSGQLLNIATAAVPALMRLGSGAVVSGYSVSFPQDDGTYAVATVNGRQVKESSKISTFKRPAKPLELYEFEGCPFCRKVREAVSILDLDVIFYPCPKGGVTWRPRAIELGGKKQFPYLVDPNTNAAMYESDAIIEYLFKEYGDGQVPLLLRLGAFTAITAGLGMMARAGKGVTARKSVLPEQPLVLYSYEASPFCKVVKEVLCDLELPHLQRSVARGSPKRQELLDLRGHFQVPYLEDPNKGVYLFESAAIIQYLEDTYAVKA